MKLCECGCGRPVRIAPRTSANDGWVKGQPMRFYRAHKPKGEQSPHWKGGRRISRGYVLVANPGHPRADSHGYVAEHILVAESILGGPVPRSRPIHHINGNRADNRPENIVVCVNQAHHMKIHQEERAIKACGNATWRKCYLCQRYDDPANLRPHGRGAFKHKRCWADLAARYKAAKKEKARSSGRSDWSDPLTDGERGASIVRP